eukprot:m.11939 g.11939  ORF g.11939 m.11939 type:complete len:527 (-) comp4561_c0_seq1:78-1658(-)
MLLHNSLGQKSRVAVLQCVKLAKAHPTLSHTLLHSHLYERLTAGLTAEYAGLPNRLTGSGGKVDWRLNKMIPEIQGFLDVVLLCDSVARICQPTHMEYFNRTLIHGFFMSVLFHALHDKHEKNAIAPTAYLDLCIRKIENHELIRTFVEFIFLSESAGTSTFEVLVSRIEQQGDISLVTLRLFHSLFELNCENVFLDLFGKRLHPLLHSSEPLSLSLVLAARKFSGIRFLSWKSPGGTTFENYEAIARSDIENNRDGCTCWTVTEALQLYKSDGSKTLGECTFDGNLEPKGILLWTALMNKLNNIMDQPLRINLMVTSVLYRIATYPWPSMLPIVFDTRDDSVGASESEMVCTLYKRLDAVSRTVDAYRGRTQDFEEEMDIIRTSLDGGGPSTPSNPSPSNGRNTMSPAPSSGFRKMFETTVSGEGSPQTGGFLRSMFGSMSTKSSPISVKRDSSDVVQSSFADPVNLLQASQTEDSGALYVLDDQEDLEPPKEKPSKKALLGVLVFEEFCKEMAAVCLAHASLPH